MRYRTPAVRETKSIELSAFRGIDLSNPPSKVKPYRATHMKNLWNVNGVNRKRPGLKQITRFDMANGIVGMCKFALGDYGEFFVCCGTHKILVYNRDTVDWYSEWKLLFSEGYTGREGSLQYAVCEEKAYLYGIGVFFVLYREDNGNYVLKNVYEDEDAAYIPITTVNIGPDDRENDIKAVAEAPNRLSRFRRNRLSGTDSYDGKPLMDIDELWADANSASADPKFSKWTLDTEVNGAKSLEVKFSADKKIVLNFEEEEERFSLRYRQSENSYDCLAGYIRKGSRELYLYFRTAPEAGNEFESNITVTVSNESKKLQSLSVNGEINDCTCSVIYGLPGGANHIFLARGESPSQNKNVIFYSGVQFETGKSDFTYFPEDNTIALGDSGTAIKGLIYSNDGRLLALKEKKNNEPTVYYIDGETVTDEDGSGKITYYREIFKAVGGQIGEECISQQCLGNLSGDILMLSKNGVFGIVNPTNVYSSGEKAVRMRSKFVNADLLKTDLRNAVAAVCDNRYFLAAGRKIYVADARYKTSAETGDMADTFNYEWWVWEVRPEIRAMTVIGDRLIFGASDGGIYKLAGDFYDHECRVLKPGELTAENAEGSSGFAKFAVSRYLEPKIGDYFVFANSIKNSDNREMKGEELYVVSVSENGTSVGLSDKEGGEAMTFLPYEEECPAAKLYRRTAVVSEWVTPVFDMGSISKKKLLTAVTVSAEKQKKASLEVGYHTRNEARDLNFNEFESKGLTYFDWSFGFDAVTYDNQFASSYTKAVRDYFNFISFCFRSPTACDMAVNALEVRYKVISDSTGVY